VCGWFEGLARFGKARLLIWLGWTTTVFLAVAPAGAFKSRTRLFGSKPRE